MFKPLAIALAAALTLFAVPALAQDAHMVGGERTTGQTDEAQTDAHHTNQAAPPDAAKIEADAHAQGKKDVPGVVQAAGFPCTVTDGYYAGIGDQKDDAGKTIKVKIYEAACKEGLGYIIIAPPTGQAKHYDCISLAGGSGVHCRLPANLDAKAQLAPIVAQTGRTCTVSNARGMGATSAGDSFYEVGCQGSAGFVLERHASAGPEAIDCARTLGTNLECKFTSKTDLENAQNAVLQALIAKSGKTCTLSGSRTMGADSAGNMFYEVACGSTGYIIVADKTGAFSRAVDCAKASAIGGGCKLTDAVAAETSESGLYTQLARAGGYDCSVSKYRYIGIVNKNDELVELACTNRADGAMAIFPDDKNTPATFYDCVRAGAVGQECKLSSPSVVYDKYTAALAARGKTSCKVSNASWIGTSSTEHTDFVETACTDGLPGWVIELTRTGQAKSVLTCGEARSAGITCKLPGNEKR